MCLYVSEDISGTRATGAIFTNFFALVAYARGSVLLRHVEDRRHHLSAGRGDGSAHRGRSVIYDCLVLYAVCWIYVPFFTENSVAVPRSPVAISG